MKIIPFLNRKLEGFLKSWRLHSLVAWVFPVKDEITYYWLVRKMPLDYAYVFLSEHEDFLDAYNEMGNQLVTRPAYQYRILKVQITAIDDSNRNREAGNQ